MRQSGTAYDTLVVEIALVAEVKMVAAAAELTEIYRARMGGHCKAADKRDGRKRLQHIDDLSYAGFERRHDRW